MKKLIVFVLCMAVLMTSCVFVSAEGISDSALAELREFGIFQGDENGNLNLDDTITRAEFCKVILSALGYSEKDLAGANTASFLDVDDAHWAKTYIAGAKQMGLIDGHEDGTFLPEKNISATDVLKITVSALGYGPRADELGGYPEGYCTVAKNLGLNNETRNDFNAPALRGETAQIIYNALNTPIMQATGFGAEKTYQVMDGSNGTSRITLRDVLKEKIK